MSLQFLIGINSIGNNSDFIKIKNYGFFYWLTMPQTATGLEIQQKLNNIMFNTLQRVEIPEWPINFGEQATYIGMKIAQPVPAGIGASNGFTLEYIDVLSKPGTSQVLDIANEAFVRWQYEINFALNKGYIISDIRPTMRTAAACYVLLSPDLTEIWGGEIFGGVLLEEYDPAYKYNAGQSEIRKVTARFKFQERIPIYTVMQGGSTASAFYGVDISEAIQSTIAQAQSIFTMQSV